MNPIPEQKINKALNDQRLQLAIYDATGRLMQKRKDSVLDPIAENFEAWRDQANAIKRHTIENLDHGEGVSFSAGATVSRDRSLTAGVASRPNGRLLPLWPLLRPGDNDIRVSGGSATFSWRDTW